MLPLKIGCEIMNKKIMALFLMISFLVTSCLAIPTTISGETKKTGTISPIEEPYRSVSTLTFGPQQDASTLPIKGIRSSQTTSFYKDAEKKTISVHFEPSQCMLYYQDVEQTYIEIKGLEPYGSPGNPMLPMKTFIVKLPKNAEILDVGMINGYYQEIKEIMHIVPNPEPVFWLENTSYPEKTIAKISPNKRIYGSDHFFPGKIVSYELGKTNKDIQMFLHVYPLQYIPKLGKVILLTDGQIQIYYQKNEKSQPRQILPYDNTVNVIITPPEFMNQALELKSFHDVQGTPSSVVTTSWIYTQYNEAPDPPYEGYSNSSLPDWNTIHDYNYSLAKKIIAYLNDDTVTQNLQYVTLFGNALLIPPSYYSFPFEWVPTDFFYASPDYDRIPNFYVGRLPINTVDEATQVVEKIKNWDGTTDIFRNITVAGDKPFLTPYDIGEMITNDAINQGFFRGITPTKCYGTDETFDKTHLMQALQGNTGLVYHIGHGSGTAWLLEGDPLAVNDILSLPPSNTTPIVISIACMNGAFDTQLVNMGFEISFGESLLLSQAGGIAYIGGSRSNAGVPFFHCVNGSITISKEPYMAGMLTNVIQAYHDGGTSLGNLTAQAITTYIEHTDFSDPVDNFTFFSFVLLGDPALQLPAKPIGNEYEISDPSIEKPLAFIDAQLMYPLSYAGYGEVPLGVVHENVTVSATTSSPTVTIKLVDGFKFHNMTLEKIVIPIGNNTVSYTFVPSNSTYFSIRIISEDGQEKWLYLTDAAGVVDDDYNETTPGWGIIRWAVIQDAIDHSQQNDIIYVCNGTYHENILLNKQLTLFAENSTQTIINGNGTGSVVTITGSSCNIAGFTITNGGAQNGDAGIAIKSNMACVYHNIITHNNQMGVLVSSGHFSTIAYNTFSDNLYGIYIEKDVNASNFVYGNSISNNTFGIYISKSMFQIIWGNNIKDNDVGVDIVQSTGSEILYNNFTTNKKGIYLLGSNNNQIVYNNFIDNQRHGQFFKCRKNTWAANYWDNWIGLRFNLCMHFPKCIFGRAGQLLGMISWVNFDFLPARTPNAIWMPYEK